jgi:hypothetical protein
MDMPPHFTGYGRNKIEDSGLLVQIVYCRETVPERTFGPFAIIPAGHRGAVLWWGSIEKRVMGEGFNFKAPLAESVIKVDVRVQPHLSSV